MSEKEINRVVLFDGVCNLCNSSVNYIIEKDKAGKFKFASLQSEYGQDLLKKNGFDMNDFDSFILEENGSIYQKSTAALRVVKEFPGLWKALYAFIIIPPFIRNVFYDIIAKNRYKWFGKKDACMMPTPELREKFL